MSECIHKTSAASRSERKLVRARPTLWSGIRELAAMCAVEAKAHEFSAKATVDAVEAELRRRVEPLLEKFDKVLLLAHEHISPTLAAESRKEIHSWRKS